MKITVKTTQQKVFQIEVEGTDTVAVLKSKIEASQGHSVANQKIIYLGKILSDDKTVESCVIKEKDFLVLMVSKPKPTPTPVVPPPANESSTPAPGEPKQTTTQEQEPSAPAVSTPSSTLVTASAVNPVSFGDPSAFLSGPQLQAAIDSMVEMGFPRDQVLRAMHAGFNNADRAVEYLMSGIPSHLDTAAPAAPAAPAPPTPASSAPPASTPLQRSTSPQPIPVSSLPTSGPQNLFQLAQQQQQQQQQQVGGVAGNIGVAGSAPGGGLDLGGLQLQQLQQLATQNPGLLEMIARDPALLNLLRGESGQEEEEGDIPPGAQVINVTEEERDAIQRLEALGFSRQAVLEAYLACDKNEELAANYLFESSND